MDVGSAGEETGVDEDCCSGIRDFDRRAVGDLFEETEEGDLVIYTFTSYNMGTKSVIATFLLFENLYATHLLNRLPPHPP